MTTIESTLRTAVGTSVPREYQHLLTQAVSVLQAREDRIVENLVRIAGTQGLSRAQVLNSLAQAREEAAQPVQAQRPTVQRGGIRYDAPRPAAPRQAPAPDLGRVARDLRDGINRLFDDAARALNI